MYHKKFPMDTRDGVIVYLKNRHYVKEAQANGDFNAINYEVEFSKVFDKIKFTERQKLVLLYMYEQQLSEREAGLLIGVSQQAVNVSHKKTLDKIVEAFEYYSR